MKKAITLILAIILASSIVSAIGFTIPQPQSMELKPGQSSYFVFQIQTDDFPVICSPTIENADGLEFAFNQQYEVDANSFYNVRPQVIVPKQTPLGDSKATFCMECEPSSQVAGSRVITKMCNLPINVNVVSERTRDNMFEEEAPMITIWITLLILAIIILAIIIYILIKKRKRMI